MRGSYVVPPNPSQSKPPVLNWFAAYCALLALAYVVCVVAGIVLIVLAPADKDMSETEAQILGGVVAAVCLLLLIAYGAGPFLPQKPWAWVFGLVLICIGLTSACCLPAAIPLLIFWLKPETKAYFGRT